MEFATKETLVQPVGGLIVEDPDERDHLLGASGSIAGPDFDILCPDGQWANYAPVAEIQNNRFGDNFMCVSYSNNNAHEFILRRRYGDLADMSDIFLGKGSGTQPGRGNSKRTVAEWKRLNGFVLEADYPYTQDMPMDKVYAPLSTALLAKGRQNLKQYQFFWKWLPSNSADSLIEGLKFSPLQVDVTGFYPMDDKGRVIWSKDHPSYTHEVVLFGYELNVCWYVFDSEAQQYIKFAWDYPFGSPMVHSVRRLQDIQLFKKKGKSGIAVKTFGEPSMIVFSGGSITGDVLFKSVYCVDDFSKIPIKEVDEWPFPIKHVFTSVPAWPGIGSSEDSNNVY